MVTALACIKTLASLVIFAEADIQLLFATLSQIQNLGR